MAEADDNTVKLQVASAQLQDAVYGLARFPRNAMASLCKTEGQIVELVGKRHTAAIAVDSYQEDQGLATLRLDGLQCVNAGATSGDFIEVKKADVKPATRVVLAPAQKNLRLQGSGEALRRTFYQPPMVAGDVISTSVQQHGRSGDPRMSAAMRGFAELPSYGLQEIHLVVVSTRPRGIVQMTEASEVEPSASTSRGATPRSPTRPRTAVGGANTH